MNIRRKIVTRVLYGLLAACVSACSAFDASISSDHTPVVLTPVHHLGRNYTVTDVYVNGHIAGGAGRLGGGGAMNCCVLLPGTWRSSLVATVTWTVLDWSNENPVETNAGTFRSISTVGTYVAEVPIERYDAPETLYIHFFTDGKVRVVASFYDAFDQRHPVSASPTEAQLAMVGKLLPGSEGAPRLNP